MCTVIYLPNSYNYRDTGGFILSSNRDENPERQAENPQIIAGETGSILFPAVDHKNSSWIGAHTHGHIIVLLNGGFENHIRQPFYRKSRGVILCEMLDNVEPLNYWKEQDLENIEPFTLVLIANGELHELVWDGDQKHLKKLPGDQSHIWSSSTLYNPNQKRERTQWFEQWLNSETEKNKGELFNFLSSYNNNDYGFLMNRHSHLKTLSVSILEVFDNELEFNYHVLGAENMLESSIQTVLKIER